MFVKQLVGNRVGEIIDLPKAIAETLLAQGRVAHPSLGETEAAQEAGLVLAGERVATNRRRGK